MKVDPKELAEHAETCAAVFDVALALRPKRGEVQGRQERLHRALRLARDAGRLQAALLRMCSDEYDGDQQEQQALRLLEEIEASLNEGLLVSSVPVPEL